MKNNNLMKILVTIAYAAMVYVNYLANALPIGGVTTGEASDSFGNLFTPAGLTFAIWGLIYLFLGIYVVYQFWVKDKKKNELLGKINLIFLISSIANISWIFAWHYGIIWLSLIIMLVLLGSLIMIADIVNSKDGKDVLGWLICLPFSIYFGWITVATIANVTVLLVSLGWDGFGVAPEVWTIIVLLVGATIGIWQMLKDKNIPYGLVLVWAYGGIWLKHFSEDGFGGQYPNIVTTVIICEVLFLVVAGYLVHQSQKKVSVLKK